MSVEWTVVIAIGATIFGAIITYLAFRRNANKDIKENAENDGVLRSDVGYIKRTVDEIRLDQKGQERRINDISDRVTRVEESTKQAHKRIDEIQK